MRTKFRLTLSFLLLPLLAGCGDDPADLFAKAKEDFAAQHYQQARVRLAAALKKRPEDKQMLALLIETHLETGDADAASAAIARYERVGGKDAGRMKAQVALLKGMADAALRLVGDDPSPAAWRVRGQAHLMRGDKAAARNAFEKGMARGGDIPLATTYARYLLEDGNYARAATLLRQMQAIAPNAYSTLVLEGDLAIAQGQGDRAARAYRSAIDAFPEQTAPMLALATYLDGKGDIAGAEKLLDQAAKVAPDDAAVDEMKIQLMSERGQWQKIRLALQGREATLAPGSALAMSYGEALLRLGQTEQARLIFKRAALALPGNPYSRMMLGEAQLASGDAAGAWTTLRPLASSTLARPEVLERAAAAAQAVGAPEADMLKARLDPARLRPTLALIEQGEAALADGRWATAEGIYKRLLLRGDDPEVLKRLAFASSKLNDHAAAIRYADRAVALDNENADYLYVAGLVRVVGKKDLRKAVRLLEAAADIDPRNEAIAGELKRAKAAAG